MTKNLTRKILRFWFKVEQVILNVFVYDEYWACMKF